MAEQYGSRTPTKEDLLKLPRWARVAFAARCAERVQPLFAKYWPDAPREHRKALADAIRLAVSSARVGRSEESVLDGHLVHVAHDGANAVVNDARVVRAYTAAYAATAIARAAYAAAYAYAHNYAEVTGIAADLTAEAGINAAVAYNTAEPAAAYAAARAAWRDYDVLTALVNELGLTDDSPVDPDLLGPLWPTGRADSWPPEPAHKDTAGGLEITVEVPNHVSDEQAFAWIEDYVQRLNTLHRAMGGKGLRISPPADVQTPVGTSVGVSS